MKKEKYVTPKVKIKKIKLNFFGFHPRMSDGFTLVPGAFAQSFCDCAECDSFSGTCGGGDCVVGASF